MVFGIGTDLIEIQRIRETLQKFPQFANRFFHREETTFCEKQFYPAQHYAVRFCAKEAIAKALGLGMRGKWIDIIIDSQSNRKPYVLLEGKFLERAKEKEIKKIELSLSHSGPHAIAFAIALQ